MVVTIVWPTTVGDYEREFLQELLPADAEFVREPPGQPCVFVVSYWGGYPPANIGHPYGVIYLSDEMLSRDMDRFVHDPDCKFIWRQYVHPRYADHPKVAQLPCAYKSGFRSVQINKNTMNKKKGLLWSFAGSMHDERRRNAIEHFNSLTPYRIHETPPMTFNAPEGLSTSDYRALIEDSKYVICPDGKFSMECSRLYEALEAGAVPVTVENGHMITCSPSYHHFVFPPEEVVGPIPFVIGKTWSDAHRQVLQIESFDMYKSLQEECIAYWARCKRYWADMLARQCAGLTAT